VRDRRVREHALDVVLAHRRDISDRDRDRGDHDERAGPAERAERHGVAPSATPNTRIIAAIAAAFTAAAMKPVTGVGAPSYASGPTCETAPPGDLEAERDHEQERAGDHEAGVGGLRECGGIFRSDSVPDAP